MRGSLNTRETVETDEVQLLSCAKYKVGQKVLRNRAEPGVIINIHVRSFLDQMIRCYWFEDRPFPYYEFELSRVKRAV